MVSLEVVVLHQVGYKVECWVDKEGVELQVVELCRCRANPEKY